MKRNLSACLAVAFAFALSLALAGCGGSSGASASSEAPSSSAASAESSAESAKAADEGFAGTWKLSAMDDLEDEGLESMIDSGYCMFFVLQEDGTASYEFLGFADKGTYQPKSDTEASLTLTDEDNWKDKMFLEDGQLKVESVDGGFAYFTRITEAEHQAYNDEYGYDPDEYALDGAAAAEKSDSSDQAGSAALDKVIVDDELCTIKVLDTFGDDGVVGYKVEITNKTDRELTFTSGGMSGSNTVGGKEVSFIFYEDVDAGQTVQGEFDYWESDLEGGVEKLVDVKGVINVNDMSVSDTIASYDFAL